MSYCRLGNHGSRVDGRLPSHYRGSKRLASSELPKATIPSSVQVRVRQSLSLLSIDKSGLQPADLVRNEHQLPIGIPAGPVYRRREYGQQKQRIAVGLCFLGAYKLY